MEYRDRHSQQWPLNPRLPYNQGLHQSIKNADAMLASALVLRSKQRAERALIEAQLEAVRRSKAKRVKASIEYEEHFEGVEQIAEETEDLELETVGVA